MDDGTVSPTQPLRQQVSDLRGVASAAGPSMLAAAVRQRWGLRRGFEDNGVVNPDDELNNEMRVNIASDDDDSEVIDDDGHASPFGAAGQQGGEV